METKQGKQFVLIEFCFVSSIFGYFSSKFFYSQTLKLL